MSRNGTVYSPLELVKVVLEILVCELVTVTLASGTTAPLTSVTRPTSLDVAVCAYIAKGSNMNTKHTQAMPRGNSLARDLENALSFVDIGFIRMYFKEATTLATSFKRRLLFPHPREQRRTKARR